MAEAVGSKNGKAFLLIKEPSKDGGKAKINQVDFLYNPEKFTVDKTANWLQKPEKTAKQGAKAEFTGGTGRSMSVDIFLDAGDENKYNLAKDIELLFKCCGPTDKSIQQNAPSPPFVTLGWGKNKEFRFDAVVESVSVEYKMFTPEGLPLRAVAKLKLKEIPKEQAGQNPTSGALAAFRTHTVIDGDSLASIAYNEYGDPSLWRAVAETNDVDDPLRLRAGTTLLLPDVEEASAYR